jgi:hypothetical protein
MDEIDLPLPLGHLSRRDHADEIRAECADNKQFSTGISLAQD